jgi:SNF2 family DNA or RNA helicase
MSRLEDLQPNASVQGILPNGLVTVVNVQWFGSEALELTFKDAAGKVANELLYRHDESRLEVVQQGRPWSFDGDGGLFRLAAEAQRIRLAHLFDPVLAVHTSVVEPLPHQITAVYEAMLPRQPLRFLLADDPGAGKTIMAGLLMKELIARGDLQRCLVVCPGSLAEQWQGELRRRFNLPFEILTNDKFESSRTGNWFLEANLVIARLDKLKSDESLQQKLQAPDCGWDLIVCDEAHKLSATLFGNEVKYTKRYRLAQLLSSLTRHFLLMTATPHNGKEADFQLFMALLDQDRFEGSFREKTEKADVSDLMRRMVKESLLKFDAKPLFPERIAYTVPYKLSEPEEGLYVAVTEYVREEFNRAEKLQNDKRAGTVGFALTILQRRLASSPEAIYQSLRRRRERLQARMRELEAVQRGGGVADLRAGLPAFDDEDADDFDDAPDHEHEDAEAQIVDEATAARSLAELATEVETLKRLEAMALSIRRAGEDRKWRELAELLGEIFTQASILNQFAEPQAPFGGPVDIPKPVPSPRQKLVIFTEHRDTLNYLAQRVSTLLGRANAVVTIHGGIGREARLAVQEAFRNEPEVQVLLATDAAGEGINLQRAHLMVNYDLPWNPNRLEQRFGRIHRIGQTEVCHLWNLVAEGTREGEVYLKLLQKLEQARATLGGQVFDVLGKIQFEGRSLRDLLIDAIRYGEQPDVRARLNQVVENAFDRSGLQDLLEDNALAHDSMDVSKVRHISEQMERAEAKRLQPHYIESFFIEAFSRLGGTIRLRETGRFEITNVPASLRRAGSAIPARYERVAFDKSLLTPPGLPPATFLCPGHPLLDSAIDLTLERDRDLLRRGAILVDDRDAGITPRVLYFLEHGIQDGSFTRSGERRVVSKRLLFVEIDGSGAARHLNYAPYLDYRPLAPGEPDVAAILATPEVVSVAKNLEAEALAYAIANVVPEHLAEFRSSRTSLLDKTEAAVKARLMKEIQHWDARAEALKADEAAGKINARLNANEARKRADNMSDRLRNRLDQIKAERQISPLPPVVLGGVLVVPAGLIAKMTGHGGTVASHPVDTQFAAAKARAIIMEIERGLGFVPVDREFEKLGYDIESAVPGTGRLRFIEVKGRVSGAQTITVTRNEILYSLNKPDDFILGIVEFLPDGGHNVHYVRKPFQREPDFAAASVNYEFSELIAKAQLPA